MRRNRQVHDGLARGTLVASIVLAVAAMSADCGRPQSGVEESSGSSVASPSAPGTDLEDATPSPSITPNEEKSQWVGSFRVTDRDGYQLQVRAEIAETAFFEVDVASAKPGEAHVTTASQGVARWEVANVTPGRVVRINLLDEPVVYLVAVRPAAAPECQGWEPIAKNGRVCALAVAHASPWPEPADEERLDPSEVAGGPAVGLERYEERPIRVAEAQAQAVAAGLNNPAQVAFAICAPHAGWRFTPTDAAGRLDTSCWLTSPDGGTLDADELGLDR